MSKKFSDLVKDKFSFLIHQYSFICADENESCVRFESREVFVSVHYDANRSYEIGVEIGQKDALYSGQERPFNLEEVLRLKGVEEKKGYRTFQAADSTALENCISRFAVWLETYATDLLKNDQFSFKRLSDLREKECDQYELEAKLSHIRREAQVSWSKKDYMKVLELYLPVEKYLSDSEKKKLAFVQRQIKNN